MVMDPLEKLVDEWLAIDVNVDTRKQIQTLAQDIDGNRQQLNDLLGSRIVFGTAGLRAKMEAGFNRMNEVTVLQASQGLAAHVCNLEKGNATGKTLNAVIGHDHRHNSKRFAELAAAAFLIKGFKVYMIGPDVCATPMVPLAVDLYQAATGIMITASHNPKDDNGYKVYWSNGCQIIPPHDSNIQDEILRNLVPWDEVIECAWDTNQIFARYKYQLVYCYDEILQAYSSTLLQKLGPNPTKLKSKMNNFKVIYTAMHGVGTEFVTKILSTFFEMDNFVQVTQQCRPNADFPTVKFPNPEERGALDLAIETAKSHPDVELILANDPDADRFTLAYKDTEERWKQLTGNEIGILFADYVIRTEYLEKQRSLKNVYLLNSTVSSQMIGSMAEQQGFQFQDTLTGFKWIGNRAIELESAGYEVPFAYEEAIGFMFSTLHDKDGISALVVFLKLYHTLLQEGLNPGQKLEQLYAKFGYFKQCNGYYMTTDLTILPKIFDDIIRVKNVFENASYPDHIGQYRVVSWRDLTTGFDSSTANNVPDLFVDPSSQMITCQLHTEVSGEFIRFTARGSGTEPKLKVYIEAKAADEIRAEYLAGDVWNTLRDEWFKPETHGLVERLV